MAISEDQKKGTQRSYDQTSITNQLNFAIKQVLRNELSTSFLARIDLCESKEELSGASYVSITPLITQTDTEGKALPMVSIPKVPHFRYQQGIAAFVVDPVPGDIVTVVVDKNDHSPIKEGVTEPVNAGSFRQFSPSDATVTGAVHTKTPTTYIVLRQDDTIKERGPEGIRVETDKTLDEQALEHRLIKIGQNRQEDIGQNSSIKIGQNLTQEIGQNAQVTIGGNSTMTVSGNDTLTINGGCTISIQGALNENVASSAAITIAGSLTIKAANITFDTPNASFTGNVSIAGGLSQGGGAGRSTKGRAAQARALGNGAYFYNNINTMQNITALGNIAANGDVTAGSISLKSHTHEEQGDGEETSPPL